MRLKYHYEFIGWDGLLLLNILHNNQLKELGDISNNAIVNLPVHVFQGLIFLKEVNLKLMYNSFTSNKLQDNAESGDTFINKAILTVASYTRTIYYKYNRISVFYHIPFAFMGTNSKMCLFKHTVFMCSTNCLFYLYFNLFFGDLSKMILPLSFCIALWDIYYVYLFFQDMEDDLNRIVDFLEDDFNRIVDF